MKPLSTLEWWRNVCAHHQWILFQAIRFAMWLVR
jgi:hypothetical protein